MCEDDVTVTDVLIDPTKNLSNILDTDNNQDFECTYDIELPDNEYFTESDFIDFTKTANLRKVENLFILSLNIANLLSKLNSLKSLLSNLAYNDCKPDLIFLVETHIPENHKSGYSKEDLMKIIPGYNFFSRGRKERRGGGVGILVNRNINIEPKLCDANEVGVEYIEEKFENLVVKLPGCLEIGPSSSNNKRDLILVVIYRQPNSGNLDNFLDSVDQLLQKIDKPSNEIIIAGDMNLDLLKYETHPQTAQYLDIMSSHRLLPQIVRPTRIKHQSATLIDHIFTRGNDISLMSGILDLELAGNSGYTDHKPTFIFLKAKIPPKKYSQLANFSFFTVEGNKNRKEGLKSQDWDGVLSLSDPDLIYDQLIAIYSHHYYTNLTTRTISRNSRRYKREPWMTDKILADMRRRDRLARNKNRRAEYKKLRNEITKNIRKAQKSHVAQRIQGSMGDIKKHWKILKETINRTNNKEEIISEFFYKGRLVSDDEQNANCFNDYLANIGKDTNESVGHAKKQPDFYLNKFKSRNQDEILVSEITAEHVDEVCKNMTPKESTDPDGFKQKVVLDDANILAPIIAHLVNCSLQTGRCPTNSKLARVIPVYKLKGDKHSYENYRPISLLSSFSKIVERLIYDKIFEFLVRCNIIFKSQFGFRKGHNTTHATLDFVKAIEEAIGEGDMAIGVFCDLSKAFDTLNHSVLISKLDHYGIRGKMKEWLQSYLSGREQYVEFKGVRSYKLPLPTGVPQGSVLGPLLFLLYINDLPAAANLKAVMFADDTNLLVRGKDTKTLSSSLNTELEGINDYFKANKLKLNTKKTKLVCFRKKNQKVNYDDLQIFLDGDKLTFDEDATFLGIKIDSSLTWDKHCTHVANTISRNNSFLNRVKNFVPAPSLKILYNSFILPHLQYGLAAWGGCKGESKKRIINVQKRAIRTISKSYRTAHTEPRMKTMGILKLEELYSHQCSVFIHDIIMNKAPPAIINFIALDTETTTRNLRSHSLDPLHVKVPPGKCKLIANSFYCKGPQLWNAIPRDICNIEQNHLFKRRLKQYFLSSYTDTAHCSNQRCTDKRHHHQ